MATQRKWWHVSRPPAPPKGPDPADLGTVFGLEAQLADEPPMPAARGEDSRVERPWAQPSGMTPLSWLSQRR